MAADLDGGIDGPEKAIQSVDAAVIASLSASFRIAALWTCIAKLRFLKLPNGIPSARAIGLHVFWQRYLMDF